MIYVPHDFFEPDHSFLFSFEEEFSLFGFLERLDEWTFRPRCLVDGLADILFQNNYKSIL